MSRKNGESMKGREKNEKGKKQLERNTKTNTIAIIRM
jgi:hypothetical protein